MTRIDVAVARVIELDGAHAAVAHDERRRDAGVQARKEPGLARRGGLARKDLHVLTLQHAQCAAEHHGRTRGTSVGVLTPARHDGRPVRHADGRGERLGQDDLARAERGLGSEAMARVGKDLAGNAQRAVGCRKREVIGGNEHVGKKEA